MSYLVEAGADVEAADVEGMTPLLVAAEAGAARAVELMIKLHKAKTVIRDASGRTALGIARDLGLGEIEALLVGRLKIQGSDSNGAG
jgi:uncharacterized protein